MTDKTSAHYLQSDLLASCSGISHGFFTREGGVSEGIFSSLNVGLGSGDEPEKVLNNRALVTTALGVSCDALATPFQVHGGDCAITSTAWSRDDRPKLDAVATATPGLAVGILTADCGPVLFCDPNAGVIAAAHAGWKGAFSGVLETTVEKMRALGASTQTIVAVLGPTISQANYEVGPQFKQRFTDADENNEKYFAPSIKEGHSMFDLQCYIMGRLARLGIEKRQSLGVCTYADEKRFFSYRRATHQQISDYGRMIAAISLKQE